MSGDCASSPNHPSDYGDGESCTITALRDGRLDVQAFNTESCCDHLAVGGQDYDGTTGPDGVTLVAGNNMQWSSDAGRTRSGWQICLDSPTALPNRRMRQSCH